MSWKDPLFEMAHTPDKKPEPEKTPSPRPPKTPRRLQIPLPFSVGSFSSVPSTEMLLTSVLLGSPIILCVLDSQLNITYIEGKGLEEFRLAPGQLVGHPFFELAPDTQELRALCDKAFAGDLVRTLQRIRERMYNVTLLPVIHQDASVSGVIVVATDATFRETEESEGPKSTPSRAQKDLVLQVTHELRTPLNSVLGFANLLLRSKDTELNEQDRFYLDRIVGNTSHLLQVIGQILDFSLHTAGKLSPELANEDIGLILEETLGDLKELTSSDAVTIIPLVPAGTLPVKTDRVKLKQIITNLVANALKYTSKGTITVTVHTDARLQPVRIDVTDTGEGIPKDKLTAIFEAFDRGVHDNDRVIEGAGMGLTIVKTLCDLLGYSIAVYSEKGKGSTFSVHLVPPATPL